VKLIKATSVSVIVAEAGAETFNATTPLVAVPEAAANPVKSWSNILIAETPSMTLAKLYEI